MSSELNISIDRASPVPLYHQLAQGIEAAIRSGQLSPGRRLDNEIELAARLNLSRPTVRKAMDEMVRSGLLVRKRGVGTQVVSPQVHRPLELSSLYDDLLRDGGTPRTKVLDFARTEAGEVVRETLGLASGAGVYHFTRLRTVDDKPLALMENWVVADGIHLDAAALGRDGLYRLLRAAGINFSVAHQRIGATVADDYQSGQLDTERGAALVTMERTAVDDTGRAIETGRHVYRADAYSFELTLVNR